VEAINSTEELELLNLFEKSEIESVLIISIPNSLLK
jgi:hypothetical protein